MSSIGLAPLAPAFGLLILLIGVSSSPAQVVSSTLVGTVTDSSGASVPNATVAATALSTGNTQSTRTTVDGNYNLTFLSPGTYRLTIEAPGFKSFAQDNIILALSTTVRVNATLAPGSTSETITVTSESSLLQTENAEVGRNISAQTVTDLPFANRNVEAIATTLAGVGPPSGNVGLPGINDPGGTTRYSANGQQTYANNIMVDGSENRELVLSSTIYVPPPELVDEVRIATSNYAAEFGRVGGAVINIVSKGGSNAFHGSVWEFNRVSALAARNFFNVSAAKPALRKNDFGATAGGPIVKNKTFFLGGYHGIRSTSSTYNIYSVPAKEWGSGNFSGVPSLALFDPNTGNPNGTQREAFPNNIIPLDRINPVAQKLIPYLPSANLSVPATFGLTNNYGLNLPSTVGLNSVNGRIDQYFTDSTKMFASVQRTWTRNVNKGALGDMIGDGLQSHNATITSIVNVTHSLSPTFLSELRLNYTRHHMNVTGVPTSLNNQALGLGDPTPTPLSTTTGIVSIAIGGLPAIGLAPNYGAEYITNIFSGSSTWSKVTGAHVFKWGGVVTRNREEQNQAQGVNMGPRGTFKFNPGTTQLKGGPSLGPYGSFANSFASFLLGAADQKGRTYLTTTPTNRQTQAAGFVQDTYQPTRRLTLDIGVRYELYTTIKPRFPGGAANYDFNTNTLLIAGYGAIGMSMGVRGNLHDFSPRFGWAYRLSDESVLRGGFGVGRFQGTNGFAGGSASCQFPVVGNVQIGTVNDYIVDASLQSIPGIPVIALPKSGVMDPAPDQPFYALPFHNPAPYIMNYNVTYQRELPGRMAWDVGYVGNLARNVYASRNLHAAAPGTGQQGNPLWQQFGHVSTVELRAPGVNLNYNSLQSTVSKRLSHGLTFAVAYTFSKSLGNATTPNALDRRKNYGPVNHLPQMLTISHQYELPFGKGKPLMGRGGPIAFIVSNWQVNGILRYTSGSLISTSADATSCNCPGNSQVADVLGPVQYLGGIGSASPWFDRSSFGSPTANRFGNAGVGIIHGPSLGNYDFSVFRKFSFTERWKLEYRAEFYNVTNTPRFGNPNTNVNNSAFGTITSASGSREVQMALRVTF